jgi:hypothetical protein
MTKVVWCGVVVLAVAADAWAQEPDWPTMAYTRHSAYQTVDANGNGTFDLAAGAVKMRAVILNRPCDFLNCSADAVAPPLGAQWQVWAQAVDLSDATWDDGDFGGTALFMGKNYGSLPWISDPTRSYTAAEWTAEIQRLNHVSISGHRFRPGDLVEVRARAPGLFYAGKTNVNEEHSKALEQNFDVCLIHAAYGLPAPSVVTLADLKDSSDRFIFDPARQIGPEHYQSGLVRIDGVSFVDTAAWAPNGGLAIQDGSGRTLPVRLGRGRCFSMYAAPVGPFDIVGILDQEDGNGNDGYKTGYRLMVFGYDGTRFFVPTAPSDTDFDEDVDLADFGRFQACFNGANRPAAQSGCDDVDFDSDADVDLRDFAVFQGCFNGPNRPVGC